MPFYLINDLEEFSKKFSNSRIVQQGIIRSDINVPKMSEQMKLSLYMLEKWIEKWMA
jgi:hypothetical protein